MVSEIGHWCVLVAAEYIAHVGGRPPRPRPTTSLQCPALQHYCTTPPPPPPPPPLLLQTVGASKTVQLTSREEWNHGDHCDVDGDVNPDVYATHTCKKCDHHKYYQGEELE